MSCQKSFPLHGSIALENHVHLIARRKNWMWFFGATKSTQGDAVGRISVVYSDMIICAFLMWLHLKDFKNLENLVVIKSFFFFFVHCALFIYFSKKNIMKLCGGKIICKVYMKMGMREPILFDDLASW